MRILIKTTDPKTAINYNQNSQSWYVNIDVTELTAEEKGYLIYCLNGTESEPQIYTKFEYILDTNGMLTHESLREGKARFEEMQNFGVKKLVEDAEKRLAELIGHPERDVGYIDLKSTSQYNYMLAPLYKNRAIKVLEQLDKHKEAHKEWEIVQWLNLPDDKKIYSGLGSNIRIVGNNSINCHDPRVKAEEERLEKVIAKMKEEYKRRFEELEKKREIEAEAKKQAEIELDIKKLEQLTDVVNRLGTDTQKAKWSSGLMKRSEALDLLWSETFWLPLDKIELSAYKNNEWVLIQVCGEEKYGRDNFEEKSISTLSDIEFENFTKAKNVLGECSREFFVQSYDWDGNEDNCEIITIVRFTKTIGNYDLIADVII